MRRYIFTRSLWLTNRCNVLFEMIALFNNNPISGVSAGTNPPKPCKPGYYCPSQTPAPDRYPCPEGTFSSRADLTAASECTKCTASYYCSGGESTTTGICAPGYYCPEGTAYPFDFGCENGTYNEKEGMDDKADCRQCTQGQGHHLKIWNWVSVLYGGPTSHILPV